MDVGADTDLNGIRSRDDTTREPGVKSINLLKIESKKGIGKQVWKDLFCLFFRG